ncbi:endonuclease/exonuclease/phosphatase family protein [Nocardioides mangrovicus]|uniref:Endonuclease/exonuclease/phosphatase family protein n=1 Tax=Nocardioides mangrovicus TaxID=2478913 RepID=A0A3L8P4A7_9ACTN|nr:endonuclease/exonuclease/phosphatase family protein [Nocardioides mangrovicus]RLV49379.1 endonuclease/exonuclease/phosphatase family protein [Nocardioides mangrovicus]
MAPHATGGFALSTKLIIAAAACTTVGIGGTFVATSPDVGPVDASASVAASATPTAASSLSGVGNDTPIVTVTPTGDPSTGPTAGPGTPSGTSPGGPGGGPTDAPAGVPAARQLTVPTSPSTSATPTATATPSATATATPTTAATSSASSSFTFATFNVQGAIHRGKVAHRMALAVGLLKRYNVGVASLQEFETPQRKLFDSLAGSTYARYPTAGRSLDAENSVVWNTARFSFVQGQTRPYPYFHGATRNMPRVLLRDKQTGASFWVTSYHNPADVHGNAAKFRATAVSRQVADNNALHQTGTPVIVAGDMNDRATYFCAMSQGTGMHSADGSVYSSGCRTAKSPWIDWIMGTPDVTFSGYLRDRGTDDRAASDHPIVVSQVTVTG